MSSHTPPPPGRFPKASAVEPLSFDTSSMAEKQQREREGRIREVPFTVDGRDMVFTDPGTEQQLQLDILDAQNDFDRMQMTFDWFGEGLTEEDNEYLQSRLRDPEDSFNLGMLDSLLSGITERLAGNARSRKSRR